MRTCFVTGATGVVGSSLVPVLLHDPDVQVKLLIRAPNADELSARLEKLYVFWQVPEDDTRIRSRVEALAGDTTLPQFGLEPAAYRSLCSTVTHIIHAAGLVRMNLPLAEARLSAVGSARNVVALARACPALQKLDFVSTVGVGGRLRTAIPERWLTEPREFHNTYEQAKAEAEDYLREEVTQSPLPLTVHRPSMVVGDSRDGRIIGFQVFYFLCEFLSGRRTFGLYPDFGDATLDTMPSDVVAAALAAASAEPATIGRIFHICSGPRHAIRMDDLKRLVRSAFAAFGLAASRDVVLARRVYARIATLAARLAPPSARKALSTLPIYLDYLADSQSFDNAAFVEWASLRGITLPPPEKYLPAALDFYLAAQRNTTDSPGRRRP